MKFTNYLKEDHILILRILVSLIFITAASYRIVFFSSGVKELMPLGYNLYIIYVMVCIIIILEMICGICILIKEYFKIAVLSLVMLMVYAIASTIIVCPVCIISNIAELFVFNPTPTDVWLHFLYLTILITFLIHYKN
jgi:uncharacterized membrane protein YphA (DoxX/SURF4 family)